MTDFLDQLKELLGVVGKKTLPGLGGAGGGGIIALLLSRGDPSHCFDAVELSIMIGVAIITANAFPHKRKED